MLKTRLTDTYDLRYPIVGAPMANHSGGRLAAAVTAAGGLGTFGGINRSGPAWVKEQIEIVRNETQDIFGVGFITAFLPSFEANFAACLDERVPVLIFSFGDPTPYVKQTKDAGLAAFCQVQTLEGARAAVAAGADLLIAQGNEGGGHSGHLGTLPCLSLVLSVAGETPVIAAGGIADGSTLAAVLAAGAEGALLGTALLATPEAVEVPEHFKQLIVASDGQDTIHTRVYDILSGAPWPAGIGERVRANRLTAAWAEREAEIANHREEINTAIQEAQNRRDPEVAAVLFGQSAGMVRAVIPAAEVISLICADAERTLRQRLGTLLN